MQTLFWALFKPNPSDDPSHNQTRDFICYTINDLISCLRQA